VANVRINATQQGTIELVIVEGNHQTTCPLTIQEAYAVGKGIAKAVDLLIGGARLSPILVTK